MKRLIAAALLALTACTAEQPAAPRFEDIDACSLLQSADIDGQAVHTILSSADKTCGYTSNETEVVVSLLAEPFAQASECLSSDGGYGAVIGDRPMTRRCKDAAGTVTCEAVVEVREGQVIGLSVVKKHNDPNAVGQTTQGIAAKVLERLPVTK